MPKYSNSDIAQLAHQLTLSPRRQRLSQVAGAERLLELVTPEREYPYDFVCFHLTGYRPLRPSKRPPLGGAPLISDLVRLIEHLTQSAGVLLRVVPGPVYTQEALAERLSVSMKTIARWRQRGLSGLRVLDDERISRLVFTDRSLRRFIAHHRDLVLRGGAFKQLAPAEREHIVQRAVELVGSQRLRLQEVARVLAEETGRAVETIRYTLRRYDRACPEQALFGPGGRPKVPDSYAAVFQAHLGGVSASRIAQDQGLSIRRVEQICREMKAYELLNRKLPYVYHPEFDAPDAEQRILGCPEPTADSAGDGRVRPPSEAPAYFKALYDVPLLTAEQERDLFRRYNFCKYKAQMLVSELEPCAVTRRQLAAIDRFLESADDFQNRIIRANLRLVVSIANRHNRANGNVLELVSDGNVSLMRAVERFDFSRGFKFSTYATWAIMKNFARTIPEERYRYTRYVTGREELLETAPARDTEAIHGPAEARSLRAALKRGLDQLDDREREILACHYGLSGAPEVPTTLEQLGTRFGVTKERIRQIEKRALAKLKAVLSPSLGDYAEA